MTNLLTWDPRMRGLRLPRLQSGICRATKVEQGEKVGDRTYMRSAECSLPGKGKRERDLLPPGVLTVPRPPTLKWMNDGALFGSQMGGKRPHLVFDSVESGTDADIARGLTHVANLGCGGLSLRAPQDGIRVCRWISRLSHCRVTACFGRIATSGHQWKALFNVLNAVEDMTIGVIAPYLEMPQQQPREECCQIGHSRTSATSHSISLPSQF